MKYLILVILFSVTVFAAKKIDNIVIDGSTLSTVSTNADITLTPNGTGDVIFSPATATTVPYFDASKQLISSAVTPTELGYVSGVTSAIQTQLNTMLVDPLTTKGDIISYSSVPLRLAVGADAQVLTADSSEASGLKWAASTGAIDPTIQKFTSGSGTYTTAAGAIYIRIVMVGGGGGGGGSGTGAGTAATAGAASTFGSGLLSAGGGALGAQGTGGAGGASSLGSGPIGIALTGGTGGSTSYTRTAQDLAGEIGGSSAFGGAGNGSVQGAAAGTAGATNSGGGGGGGGFTNVAACYTGAGGGAGGYVDAIILAPSATYAYVVGAGGNAGGAGTSGTVGYAGGSGSITVYEYY